MLLAHLVANIEGEINPHYDVGPKVLQNKKRCFFPIYYGKAI